MGRETIRLSDMQNFTQELFDKPKEANKASLILKGILDARSSRISEISNAMRGNAVSNYKIIQRFIDKNDLIEILNRLFYEQAPFVIADPTNIERPQAKKTRYVGKLEGGKPGFQIVPLAFPYHGRAIPFHAVDYSSKTIANEATFRNQQHFRLIREIKELIGDKPIVMDREFSYGELLEAFIEEDMKFVIRLNCSNGVNLFDKDGDKITLAISRGEKIIRKEIYYQGKIKVNLAGEWEAGFKEPLWLISNLEPEQALSVYKARMKIEESFKDLKNLLGLDRIMNKSRVKMEKMVALVLLAYAIGLLIGEEIRDKVYPEKKARLYSGLFILLKHRLRLTRNVIQKAIENVVALFQTILYGNVRTIV